MYPTPYCDACFGHRAAASTRVFGAASASVVLALGLAVIAPLACDWPSVWVFVLALVVALVPSLALQLWRPQIAPGHATWGAAAWWTPAGELVFANAAFAQLVAAQTHSEIVPGRVRVGTSLWVASGVVCVLVLSPFLYWLYHPEVRVLNLGDEPLVVWIDGSKVARLEPSSLESREAGVTLRVKLGQRLLEARSPQGVLLDATPARVQPGALHLYAPASDGYCFWLETTHYGRTLGHEPKLSALAPDQHFWRVPKAIDSWFGANPPADSADRQSTGGVLTALRQSRCSSAPAEVFGTGR